MTYECSFCGKEYKYNQSYNNHLYGIHPEEMIKIFEEPFDITPFINGIERLQAINEESSYIKD